MREEQDKQLESADLFTDIERRSRNLLLNGAVHPFRWHENIGGLVAAKKILDLNKQLRSLTVDEYVTTVLDNLML